jgi:D-aminopeptidase
MVSSLEPGTPPRPRARERGLQFGELPVGPVNAITDVPGVEVGSVTIAHGQGEHATRTGVTAILPGTKNPYVNKVPAAIHVINGYGKPTGLAQVAELGEIETPIALTSTLSVGDAYRGLVLDALRRNPDIGKAAHGTVNPVVLECNDGELNDIRSLPITADHVLAAIDSAQTGPVDEGSVGAGAGMTCFGWKGGIGTASRTVSLAKATAAVGVLVLTNFGHPPDLMIAGRPIGLLAAPEPDDSREEAKGSIITIIATDALLDARQLGRLARRAQSGIARCGGYAEHGSGEFALAFSTGVLVPRVPKAGWVGREPPADMNQLFRAVIDATEEAIINSLFCATTVTGLLGYTVRELPVERVIELVEEKEPRRE